MSSGNDGPALSSTIDGSGLDPLGATQDMSGEAPPAPPPVLAPGTVVDGQFKVDRLLGQGGMGAVFLARDIRLDRDVALKLGNVVSASALRRVEREAIALAKLQHPNVVVVHQVGKHGDRLYIAMEYVAGGNAREWLAASPRSWRDIALLYAAAGDGLAAAHAAGFVHRDFKPDNLLVGEDDRPRVADFGLVRALGESIDPDEPSSPPSSAQLLARMTQTGSLLGTPAYMAPEQLLGGPSDARTDQFALCSAMWEALFGQRPFSGTTPKEIAYSISTAKLELPESSRRVPRRLTRALRRGMAADRDERWPTLAPLVAELRRDPARRRRNVLLASGVTVALAVAVALPLAVSGSDPCSNGTAEIATVWNPARATTLATAFERANLTATWTSLRPALDHYASAWAASHRAACRATRVDGSQSEAMLDQRMLCLTRARANLDTLLEGFAATRDAAASASQAIDGLFELARCSDVNALALQTPLPTDPALRAQIEAAAKLVDKANTAAIEGWDKDTKTGPDAALAAARATAWPPLVAQAMWVHAAFARNADGATKEYRAAVAAALAAGDDRTAAWALADGAWQLAHAPKLSECETWLDLARALWMRLGKPADLGNRIEGADAERLIAAGDPTAAIAATKRANDFGESAYPDNQVDRADYHFNLARALDAAGRTEDAEREIDTALPLAARARGEAHPMLASELVLAAELEQRLGKIDAAIANARRAVAIDEGWYGATDPRLAHSLNTLGQLLALTGDVAKARAPLERALALDPDGKGTSVRLSLTMLEAQSGNYARAIEVGAAALAQPDRDTGADMSMMLALGISHRELHHLPESLKYLTGAHELAVSAQGASSGQSINVAIELSYTLVAMGRGPAAVQLLSPALAAADLPPPVAAELHVAYGQALWATGDHSAGRRELAAARDAYVALGEPFASERAKADAWLRAHP